MKKLISLLMLIILMGSSTGCRQTKQEVDHLSVVLAMGFDITHENKYLLTCQILNTKNGKQKKDQKSTSQEPVSDVIVYSMEGITPREAINNLSTEIDRELFFGHSKYTVIGSDLAEHGLSFFMDVILRGHETRPNNLLLVTKGKASDIINTTTTSDPIPANSIESLKEQQYSKGFAPIVTRIDFANSLLHKTVAPIIGVISVTRTNNNSYNTFKMAGTAVFKKDKLVGYLDMYQTRGMQWIKGKVQSTTLSSTLHENRLITFNILKVKSQIKAEVVNDQVTIYINLKTQGNILELSEPIDMIENPSSIIELNKLQNSAIENEIKSTLYIAQKKLNADVFNFGDVIYKTNPTYWKKIEGSWDDIFPNLEVIVNVDSSLKRSGIINKPVK